MIVEFEYRANQGRMKVDLENFFPNKVGKTRKLFKLMIPNLSSQKIQEIEDWLSGKEERYLEIFREVRK